ncbi:hypothetical protein WJX82_000721 [Trebouxia sp. C0006]
MAVPFHQSVGAVRSAAFQAANHTAGIRPAGLIEQQGMPSTSYAADMLGSQANETVLIEQPQAYITQKARVKRNRRTEWDYYVQFPGFPEDEGNWYSARAIKTQHPRGAELIREFEHPDDAADVTPPPSAPRPQQTQQAVPFTQDAEPSQIGSLPMHVSGAHNHSQQPHTQDQFASQLQQPAEYRPATFAAPKPGFHMNQAHGLHPTLVQDAFDTASQNDIQPQLHWSFDRLQQAPRYKPAHFIPPSAEAAQGTAAQMQQPGWGSAQQTNWSSGLQSQWPAGPPRPALGGAPAQSQLPAKHMLPRSNDMTQQLPTQQLPNQMPLHYQQHPVAEADTVRDHSSASGQCEGQEHQQTELAAFQAASPALSDDSGLGLDIVDEVEQKKARKYMSASQWPDASISGARRVGESLELHLKWSDGYDTWVSLEALKRRQHCKSAIIDYLVSKVRKKTKG